MAEKGSVNIMFVFEDELRAAAQELETLAEMLKREDGGPEEAKQVETTLKDCYTALHDVHKHPYLMLTSGNKMFRMASRRIKVEQKGDEGK